MKNVSPKKLPGGLGWGVLVGPEGQVGETVQVVTRKGKTWEAILKAEVSAGLWATEDTEAASGSTRDRLEHRADQRETWADSRAEKRDEAWKAADLREEVSGIPFGQPILVGHHSERRHRKILARAERKGFEGLEHARMAEKHGTAAATIRRNLDQSIYDDDPDAAEALTAKIEALEAEREHIKDLNKRIRKGESLNDLPLTESDEANLMNAAEYHNRKTFPPYVLQNLGGNITKAKQRLASIKAARAALPEESTRL